MSEDTQAAKDAEKMEKIVSLCKRRGFIFQSAEIYGGLNGCWDYGPLGAELKRNLKDYWWRKNVRERDDVVGLDGSILTHEEVLKSSGHVGGFSDPMADDRLTRERLRADQVPSQDGVVFRYSGCSWASGAPDDTEMSFLMPDDSSGSRKKADKLAKRFYRERRPGSDQGEEITLQAQEPEAVSGTVAYNPATGAELTEARDFNLMFETKIGASEGHGSTAYLRPETAQSIFVQFKNVCDQTGERVKMPFGIAQIGKAFRNEINPRNFTFRSREFEQMEIEYFCREENGFELTDYWLEERIKFYEEIGIPRDKLHVLDVPDGERAHYSKKTYDIEYEFPFGIQELEGVAYRTDYDLGAHSKGVGKPQEYIDQAAGEKFIPHVVEPSAGCDRTVLALICEAYDEEVVTNEKGKEETRTVLRFDPKMAPIKCAVFPLLKNKPELLAKAKEVHAMLRSMMQVTYDETGAVGRRYRRQDEAGTPFCVTVDFDTIGENGPELEGTVTLRERDSMEQTRIPIDELTIHLMKQIH